MMSNKQDTTATEPIKKEKKRIGRPPKKKNPVGRPKGEGTILKEYRQRMLNSPKSRKVLDKMFEIALDDEHKHQAACIKLIADRILPVSSFDLDTKNTKPSVNITITGLGEKSRVDIGEDIDDADYIEVNDDDE